MYSRLPLFAVSISLLAAASVVVMHPTPPDVHAATGAAPAYTSSGDLLPLTNYREWTYLSTGIDMSYTPKATNMGEPSRSAGWITLSTTCSRRMAAT